MTTIGETYVLARLFALSYSGKYEQMMPRQRYLQFYASVVALPSAWASGFPSLFLSDCVLLHISYIGVLYSLLYVGVFYVFD